MRRGKSRPDRKPVVLVFGESSNDTQSIKELILALIPELIATVKTIRNPPIYAREAARRATQNQISRICAVIRAESATSQVVGILVHRDCDAVEPAHEAETRRIKEDFLKHGIDVLAVTPAWEMEAWLFLWPDAVSAYRPTWARIPQRYLNRNVGTIRNAKEEFRMAVQVPGQQTRGYRESDAPSIFARVRELGIADATAARSQSYLCFAHSVRHMLR